MQKYIIVWRSKLTGATGQGQQSMDKKTADAWVERMNTEYPYITHWTQEVD